MNAMVPELAVADCAASLRFYRDVLGFRVAYERPEEGFAFLVLGEAELMIDQIGESRTFGVEAPLHRPFGRGLNLQVRVGAVAPLLEGLSEAGHGLSLPLEDRWYRRNDGEVGQRQFVVADPDGYLLRFFESLGERASGGRRG